MAGKIDAVAHGSDERRDGGHIEALEQLCAGTSHFDALQLSFQKKFAQGWMLNTQYMCGRARATMAPWAEAKPMRLKTKTAALRLRS